MRTAHAPVARAFCAAALAAFVLLGAAWAIDRSRRWEPPRIETSSFVTIRGEAPGRLAGRPIWLVPINPRCPSCMARARELRRLPHERARGPRIVFLIVDRPRPPWALALSDLEADAVWWDVRGIWRQRWGHRVYGEMLRFDPDGRYRGTTPPSTLESRLAPGSEGGEEG